MRNPPVRNALRGVLGIALALTLTMLASAAGPPVPPAVARDQVDYVFFGSDRPVLIRLHVRVGEQPYDVTWIAWMDRLFNWFDVNNDGVLDKGEAARVIPANNLQQMMGGGINGAFPPALPLAQLDTNRDGKVSKEEFRAYFRKNGMGPMRFSQQNFEAATATQINESLYKRLDTNRDGKLSKEELGRMQTALRSLDENEDEILTTEELNVENNYNNGYDEVVFLGGRLPRMAAPDPVGMVEYEPGKPNGVLAARLLGQYDRNKDNKLARGEIALDREVFDQLDRNKDGFLDTSELAHFFAREPDLIFRTTTGQITRVSGILDTFGLGSSRTKQRLEDVDAKKRPASLVKNLRRVNGDTMGMTLGDARISFQVNQGQVNNFFGNRQFYLQQFDMIAGKKDHVSREQQKENPGSPFIFALFTQADRDGDGKMTRKEMIGWLDLVGAGGSVHISLTVSDQGRNLFSLLNAAGNGRLSLREMRTAWKRVEPMAKDRKAGLARDDLPRSMRIILGQGNAFFQPVPVAFAGPAPVAPRPTFFGTAPAWFRKMDHNGDGDISPKEWLGTEEEFRKIDADGDGLISAEEARRYETKRTSKSEEK